MNNQKKQETEECEIGLITTEGKEIVVSYTIPKDSDDYILESIQQALRDGIIYFGDWGDFEMKFNGLMIMELDMRKIIGIRW